MCMKAPRGATEVCIVQVSAHAGQRQRLYDMSQLASQTVSLIYFKEWETQNPPLLWHGDFWRAS